MLPQTRPQHDKIAKEYADNRKKMADWYLKLCYSSGTALFLVILDFATGFTTITFKMIFLSLFFLLTFIFYRKWKWLSTKPILTAELPTGEILVGSEKVRFRIGGDKLTDKIRKFFEEM